MIRFFGPLITCVIFLSQNAGAVMLTCNGSGTSFDKNLMGDVKNENFDLSGQVAISPDGDKGVANLSSSKRYFEIYLIEKTKSHYVFQKKSRNRFDFLLTHTLKIDRMDGSFKLIGEISENTGGDYKLSVSGTCKDESELKPKF